MEARKSEPDRMFSSETSKIEEPLVDNKKPAKNSAQSRIFNDSLYYNLNDGRKKLAYIFNHSHFKKFKGRKPSSRIGTEKDLESLKQCMKTLGFDVVPYENPDVKEIINAIKELSELNSADVSCVIVVVMTHGENNVLYASDNKYSSNRITQPIVTSKTLGGIPKFFIFQACRGRETDDGHGLELDGKAEDEDPPVVIMNADYICMYSSVENYLSWREEQGSWLIQTLCHKLKEHWKECDVVDILTFVNHTMAYEKVTDTYTDHDPNSYLYHNKRGMSQIESTLTKFLHFNK